MPYPWDNLIHPNTAATIRATAEGLESEAQGLQDASKAVHQEQPRPADRWERSRALVAQSEELYEVAKSMRIMADMAETLAASEKRELESWR